MTETPTVTVVALGGNRTRAVPLEYPAELGDGTIISEVIVRRMTSQEVADFIAASVDGREYPLPIFSVSNEIMEALDPDDFAEIDRVATEMLPRRLKRALEAPARAQTVDPAASDPPAAQS